MIVRPKNNMKKRQMDESANASARRARHQSGQLELFITRPSSTVVWL
jgi:hypothetical protein